MGTAARHINREVHADVGYAHLDIPRLELVVWPRGKPAAAADSSGSGGAEGADAAGREAAPADAAAGGSGQDAAPAAGGGGSSSAAAAQEHALPEYLRGEGAGGTAAVGRGSSSGSRRKASLQQLNSHVACLSGRWWETFGSSSG